MGIVHNLGEAATDLHGSLCHWVLFGGIFNNCLINQIDWDLGAGTRRAARPDMSEFGRGERQTLWSGSPHDCQGNFLFASNYHNSSFSYWLKLFWGIVHSMKSTLMKYRVTLALLCVCVCVCVGGGGVFAHHTCQRNVLFGFSSLVHYIHSS